MAKKDKKATKAAAAAENKQQPPVGQTGPASQAPVVTSSIVAAIAETPSKVAPPVVAASEKKGYYDPVRSKAYRDKIKAAAIVGGHVFKEKGTGTGTTIKKTSKTGKEYYYQPWSQLTEDQKKSRLESSRVRAAEDREMARKYKEEHPELFPKIKEATV